MAAKKRPCATPSWWWWILTMACVAAFWPARPARPLTIGEERDIGEKLLYMVRREFRLLDDPDVSGYINGLGREIVRHAGPQYFTYHFFVVDKDEFNAFAAPSGLVFFFSGLIAQMANEDELVGVMAHEVAHVVRRHIASREAKSSRIGLITTALAIAGLALGDPALSQGLLIGSQAAGLSAQLAYSRQDEEEADRLSYTWMREMGRDPHGLASMLKTMRRITRYRSEHLPPYLLTHPNPEARMEYVQSLIEVDHLGPPAPRPLGADFDFLRFKCRVLVETREVEAIRSYFAGRMAKARTDAERAMAAYGLAMVAAKERRYGEARRRLDEVAGAFPDKTVVRVDMARIALDQGRVDQALELVAPLAGGQGSAYARFVYGQALQRKGEPARALRIFTGLQRELGDYARLYYEMARAAAGLGDQGLSRFHLAYYQLYQGKEKLAKRLLREAAADSDLAEARRAQAQATLDRLEELDKL